MRRRLVNLIAMLGALAAGPAVAEGEGACRMVDHEGLSYSVCEFDASADIRLTLDGPEGERLFGFRALEALAAARGERLVFATNAGMYHPDYSPVGLYVEDGRQLTAANTNDGPGNFHMKPNGVFWIEDTPDGPRAHVTETSRYPGGETVRLATQSGPMLVIDGALHPRFLPDSASRKRRNGVGVDGSRIVFAITEQPVTFHEFARLFRDELGTPNALYLDGTISQLYAPDLARADAGVPLGPMIAVLEPSAVKDETP